VAVLREGQVAYEGAAVNAMTHSVSLLPMVEEALTRSGLQIKDIDLYAAVTGPGSFTGVRIGVSVVKGMAHGANKPCVGIDALEALAAGVSRGDALICPLQDARAGQVYGAAFWAGMPPKRAVENKALELGLFVEECLGVAQNNETLCFVGDGVARYRSALEELLGERAYFPPAHLAYLRPASVAMLAQAYADQAGDYLALQPQYLRAPQAERARAQKAAEA
jgi:tRNA threonylcarbamoyladenosine biosynthesis protein TsaB